MVRNALLTLATQLKWVEVLPEPISLKNSYTKPLPRVEKDKIATPYKEMLYIIPLDNDSTDNMKSLRVEKPIPKDLITVYALLPNSNILKSI